MLETRQSNWPRICRHTIFLGKPSWCPKQIIEIASIAVTSGGCGRPIWLLAAPVCSKVLGPPRPQAVMRTRSTAFDALNAFLLSIGINRIEAIQRELFGCRAKAGRFTHQPV